MGKDRDKFVLLRLNVSLSLLKNNELKKTEFIIYFLLLG